MAADALIGSDPVALANALLAEPDVAALERALMAEPTLDPPEGLAYLYAVQAGVDGPVKLGTAKAPWERIRTLQTGCWLELRGLAAWIVAMPTEEERGLQASFAHLRIRGEWFRPDPELIEYVLTEGGDFAGWKGP